MEPKTHLTSSQGALGVRNQFLGCIRVIPMLRLIPQLLRSSEIELFEGQARLGEGNLNLNPPGGGVGPPGGIGIGIENHKKIEKVKKKITKTFSSKIIYCVREHRGMIWNHSGTPKTSVATTTASVATTTPLSCQDVL